MPSLYMVSGRDLDIMLDGRELVELARVYAGSEVVTPWEAMAYLSGRGLKIETQYVRPKMAERMKSPRGIGIAAAFRDVITYRRKRGIGIPEGRPRVHSFDEASDRYHAHDDAAAELCDALLDARNAIDIGAEVTDEHLAQVAFGLLRTIWASMDTAIQLGIDLPIMWDVVREMAMTYAECYAPGAECDSPPHRSTRIQEIIGRQLTLNLKYGPPAEGKH